MGYTKKYTGDKAKQEALQDALEWLSPKQLAAARRLVQDGYTFEQFELGLSFAGLQGFPVKCLWEQIHFEMGLPTAE